MKKCIVCKGEFFKKPLLSYKNMPALAQNMPSKSELLNEKGIDFNVCQCSLCGLVQLDCDAVFYYRDVIRAGGGSTVMLDIRRNQYIDFIKKFNLIGKRFLEVGCGQGEFLQVLNEFEVQAHGIENNAELVQKAVEKGLSVHCNFIESKDDIVSDKKYDAFLSFNFLEHQPNPCGMLQGIYNNLTDDGVGIVTVPSFEYIVEHNSFYEFIRDHIAYYSEGSLRILLERCGFWIVELSRLNRDTISVYVKKRNMVDISGLKCNFNRLNSSIRQFVQSIKIQGGDVALWGASHQGFTILSTAQLGADIAYIIDSAPFKQGKYSPATHIPIVPPEYFFANKVAAIIIVAPGYSNEIYETIQARYGNDVQIAVLRSENVEVLSEKGESDG